MCVNLFIKNRLIAIDDKIEYQYNNNNRRVSKTVNGTTTYFIYEAHKLMGEYDKDGNIIKEYFYFGNTPIAMLDSTDIYNIYSDHLSTPRRVTDSKNKTVWKWESTPFGETAPTGSLEFNLRFAGQYYDNETGTHYNINRDYNPVIGRYIQSDPIGLDGGFSTFVYVNGNPVMLVDVEGLVIGTAEASEPVVLSEEDARQEVLDRKTQEIINDYWLQQTPLGQEYIASLQNMVNKDHVTYVYDWNRLVYGKYQPAYATVDLEKNVKGGHIRVTRLVWHNFRKMSNDDLEQAVMYEVMHELHHYKLNCQDHISSGQRCSKRNDDKPAFNNFLENFGQGYTRYGL